MLLEPVYFTQKDGLPRCARNDVLYRAMAADSEREAEAKEWCSGLTSQLGNLSKSDVLAVEEAIRVQLGMPK